MKERRTGCRRVERPVQAEDRGHVMAGMDVDDPGVAARRAVLVARAQRGAEVTRLGIGVVDALAAGGARRAVAEVPAVG
jgi:hypothetical protein